MPRPVSMYEPQAAPLVHHRPSKVHFTKSPPRIFDDSDISTIRRSSADSNNHHQYNWRNSTQTLMRTPRSAAQQPQRPLLDRHNSRAFDFTIQPLSKTAAALRNIANLEQELGSSPTTSSQSWSSASLLRQSRQSRSMIDISTKTTSDTETRHLTPILKSRKSQQPSTGRQYASSTLPSKKTASSPHKRYLLVKDPTTGEYKAVRSPEAQPTTTTTNLRHELKIGDNEGVSSNSNSTGTEAPWGGISSCSTGSPTSSDCSTTNYSSSTSTSSNDGCTGWRVSRSAGTKTNANQQREKARRDISSDMTNYIDDITHNSTTSVNALLQAHARVSDDRDLPDAARKHLLNIIENHIISTEQRFSRWREQHAPANQTLDGPQPHDSVSQHASATNLSGHQPLEQILDSGLYEQLRRRLQEDILHQMTSSSATPNTSAQPDKN